jgi:hypothetical protein
MGNITLRDLAHRYADERRHEVDPWRELKIQRKQLHAGSIPAPGTHINNILQHLQSDGPAPGAVFIAQNVAG